MADTKISALTAVTTPAETDEFAVNQGGVSKKVRASQLFPILVKNIKIEGFDPIAEVTVVPSAAAGIYRIGVILVRGSGQPGSTYAVTYKCGYLGVTVASGDLYGYLIALGQLSGGASPAILNTSDGAMDSVSAIVTHDGTGDISVSFIGSGSIDDLYITVEKFPTPTVMAWP